MSGLPSVLRRVELYRDRTVIAVVVPYQRAPDDTACYTLRPRLRAEHIIYVKGFRAMSAKVMRMVLLMTMFFVVVMVVKTHQFFGVECFYKS